MQITPQSLNKARQTLLKCDLLGPVVKQVGPCKMAPDKRDPFDTLVCSIISQQLSIKAADTIEQRVRILAKGTKLRPSALLKLPMESLRAAGLSGRKVEYIQGIAEAVRSRRLRFSQLAIADDATVIQNLVALRGVGQWTAEMFMIFSLGRIDVFSSLDVGLQRGMKQLFGEDLVELKTMEELAKRWSPYRSVASWYLWKMID